MADEDKKRKAVPRRADELEVPDFDNVPFKPSKLVEFKEGSVERGLLEKPGGKDASIISKDYTGYRMVWSKAGGFSKFRNGDIESTYRIGEVRRFVDDVRNTANAPNASHKDAELKPYLGEIEKSLKKMEDKLIRH